MIKYYRVIKEHPLWEEGAILANTANGNGYTSIEQLWNRVDKTEQYFEGELVVEAPENSHWFERVYKDTVSGNIFRTADQMKKLYNQAFKK